MAQTMNVRISSQHLSAPFPDGLSWLVRSSSLPTLIASLGFLIMSLWGINYVPRLTLFLVPILLGALSFAVLQAAHSVWQLHREHQVTDRAFQNTHCEFSSIFQNVLDGILILDDDANCLDGNPAVASILRVPRNQLIGKNIRGFFLNCETFAEKWREFLQRSAQRGRAELVAGDGSMVIVDFTAAVNYLPRRHILILCDVTERTRAQRALQQSEERTAQEITSRKEADRQIAQHLDATEAARAEAEALRKATLALSQNLAMDAVLDTLLQCIRELVPFENGSVLFVEDPAHLMVAREATRSATDRAGLVLSALGNPFLSRILFERKPVLLSDTATESDWKASPPFGYMRSWMGIPLTAAGTVIGILALSAHSPAMFTAEHLRLAKNLAVSAAVAIQNARVHERAEIYAAELELRLQELHQTQKGRKEPPGTALGR